MIIWNRPQEVSSFVAKGLGYGRGFGAAQAVGFTDDAGELQAGVVYHNWSPETGVIEISAYSAHRRWLNRDRLRAVFSYPFDQIKCRICVARISENNTRTLRIWRAFGAELHRIPDLRADGEAEIVAVLRRDNWKSSKFAR